jgi:prophage regulatory protein
MNQNENTKLDELVRSRDLRAYSGCGKNKVYEMIAAGKFPRPVKLGSRSVAWKKSELLAWQQSLERAGGKAA